MSFKHIFVSHASDDSVVANKLAEHLRDAGHDTKVDTKELDLGDNAIAFINDGIAAAHTVIILFSKSTKDAKWQKLEIDAAVWNEVAQDGGRCIVVRLDDTQVPPVLGPKIYGTLNASDPTSLRSLIDELCAVLMKEQTASSFVAEALAADSANPFRHLRAEFFENRPDLHAKAFASPDASTVVTLEEMKPCFLEGSRGTGKSMLLLSLRLRNLLQRQRMGTGIAIFGFYLKLSRGALCNAGGSSPAGEMDPALGESAAAQVSDIAEQEIVIQIVESLISELEFCATRGLASFDPLHQKALAEALTPALFGPSASPIQTIEGVLDRLSDLHSQVAEYIRRRFIYGEIPSVPVANFDLTLLKRLIKLVRRHAPMLGNSMFVLLLDEYENLFTYQQRIVNGFVKLGPPDLSIKVAKKFGVGDVSGTNAGQELQEIHDYSRLVLVYDVEDSAQRRAYYHLLRHIVRNMLPTTANPDELISRLLPEYSEPEVSEEKQKARVAELCKVTVETFDGWPADKRKEKWTYYGEAAIYRVLLTPKGRHQPKRFAGFNQLAFLSSGVIRYFQEILGVGYHLTFPSGSPPRGEVSIPAENQTRAVHLVSQHNVTTLSRNVEWHGEELKYFLLDLGDCLREKLLRHTSEPEAARLTVEDPERLQGDEMAPLRRLLSIGEREGVFQTKEGRPAFRPKHGSDPQPTEFNICRIYAPALEISPRLRWRTSVKCSGLLGLAKPDARSDAVQELKKAFVRARQGVADHQPSLDIV